MDDVIADSMPLWEAAANESFLKEMGENTLDKRIFYNYIIQDSLYLRDYLKAYAMAIFKSRTLKEMQVFYSVLGYVNDIENATRLKYLADCGLTDDDVEKMEKSPACAEYTDFLIETARNEDVPEILMAVMPCMLGYRYVFGELLKKYPSVRDTYFGGLVEDYASDGYAESCAVWTEYCNEICGGLNFERKEKLKGFFREASRQELNFWKMAGGK